MEQFLTLVHRTWTTSQLPCVTGSLGYGREVNRGQVTQATTGGQLQRFPVDDAVAPLPLEEASGLLALHDAARDAVTTT